MGHTLYSHCPPDIDKQHLLCYQRYSRHQEHYRVGHIARIGGASAEVTPPGHFRRTYA